MQITIDCPSTIATTTEKWNVVNNKYWFVWICKMWWDMKTAFKTLRRVMEGTSFKGCALFWGHIDILSEYCLIPSLAVRALELILLQNRSELTNLLPILFSYVRLWHARLWTTSIPPVFGLWNIWYRMSCTCTLKTGGISRQSSQRKVIPHVREDNQAEILMGKNDN